MKFNAEIGMFETSKWISALSWDVVGVGKTRDEAKADLKQQIEKLRVPPPERKPTKVLTPKDRNHHVRSLKPSVTVEAYQISSPGHEASDVNGRFQYRRNPARTAPVRCRPSLLKTVQKNRAAK